MAEGYERLYRQVIAGAALRDRTAVPASAPALAG